MTAESELRQPHEGEAKGQKLNSRHLAKQVVTLVDNFLGDGVYQGENPYELQVIDNVEATAYRLQIRRGIYFGFPWILISQEEITNPHVIYTFELTKRLKYWTYLSRDTYGRSTLPQFDKVRQRLERAWEAFKPGLIPPA